ncbi:MAG: hypothetical protein FWB98_08425 [Defluviitaleaceae bacterium]|nr:hypothetical protein [Defluviitaleaceae bacterium]
MITNLFYHSHYRDFLTRHSGGRNNINYNGNIYNRGHVQRAHMAAESSVLLNKNSSDNTLHFVRALTQNMVQLKDAARRFTQDANNLTAARSAASYEKHLQWMDADLRRFAATYNNLGLMADSSSHAKELGRFQHTVRNITHDNSILLSHVGIVEAGEQGLTYHGIGNASTPDIVRAASEAFKAAYDAARDFLIYPMATHMEFRDLGYYYNYTIGDTPANTLNLIESGFLVDFVM